MFDSGCIWKKYDGTSPFVIRDSRLEGAQFLPPLGINPIRAGDRILLHP